MFTLPPYGAGRHQKWEPSITVVRIMGLAPVIKLS